MDTCRKAMLFGNSISYHYRNKCGWTGLNYCYISEGKHVSFEELHVTKRIEYINNPYLECFQFVLCLFQGVVDDLCLLVQSVKIFSQRISGRAMLYYQNDGFLKLLYETFSNMTIIRSEKSSSAIFKHHANPTGLIPSRRISMLHEVNTGEFKRN